MKLPLELLYDIVFYLDYFKMIELFPKLGLKKFDMFKLKDNKCILVVGFRNTGKSFLIKDILYNKKQNLNSGVVITEDLESDIEFYENFLPKKIIVNDYNENFTIKSDENSFLVIENHMVINYKEVKNLILNGRHYNKMIILSSQLIRCLVPTSRVNVDYIFITKHSCNVEIEKIYKEYSGVFQNFKQFKLILEKYTDDNNVLVIDRTNYSNKLEEKVFFYKAQPHDNFKMFSDN